MYEPIFVGYAFHKNRIKWKSPSNYKRLALSPRQIKIDLRGGGNADYSAD